MFKILHLIPGRARLRIDAVKGHPELARDIRTRLEAVTHIRRVTVDTRTGGVLLLYDVRALRLPAFLDEVSIALGKVFPGRIAPGHLRIRVQRLKGRPELARALEKHLSRVQGIRCIAIDPTSGNCRLVYDSKVVASPDFLDALCRILSVFIPGLHLKKLLALAGCRFR